METNVSSMNLEKCITADRMVRNGEDDTCPTQEMNTSNRNNETLKQQVPDYFTDNKGIEN